eukprot:360819-Chlamydomonas_euryale.AAC.6
MGMNTLCGQVCAGKNETGWVRAGENATGWACISLRVFVKKKEVLHLKVLCGSDRGSYSCSNSHVRSHGNSQGGASRSQKW